MCVRDDGTLVSVTIIVIYQLPAPTPAPVPPPNTGGKITVCHIPGGNPAKAHTIQVDPSSVPAHLSHGDTLGSCGRHNDGDDHGEDDDEEENKDRKKKDD
jgi:hypothetical protein